MKLSFTQIAFLLIAFVNAANLRAQITRGTIPGEIYVGSYTYATDDALYRAILYSTNYGEDFEVKHVVNTYQDEMYIGDIIADATSGVLYNNEANGLYISLDFGESFAKVENLSIGKMYSSGSSKGVIYKHTNNRNIKTGTLYRSSDFGANFYIINSNVISYSIEVGVTDSILYLSYGPNDFGKPIYLYLSSNNGDSIRLQNLLEPEIGGYNITGHYPSLSRGTSPGELYLVSWHPPANFYIYRSIDYGQSFVLQYISDTANFYYENYFFSAGRQPGSFYYAIAKNWYDGFNTYLYIYYSNDYGKTFTEYFHKLDENYQGYSSENKILSFSFNDLNPTVTGTINHDTNKIELLVPYETDLTALIPTITISENAIILPESGIPNDFSDSVYYSVTAQNGNKREYLVIVKDTINTNNEIAYTEGCFSLFPNPSLGLINILYTTFNRSESTSCVEIYNLHGELKCKMDIENKNTIDISNLTNGIYYAVFYDKMKIMETKRILLIN